jgi:carboxypeptidase Q
MRSVTRFLLCAFVMLLVGVASMPVSGKEKKATAPEPTKPSYEMPQPAKEVIDYNAYQLIRNEAVAHSHVMEYASALMDGIGPRLTGSPNLKKANEWTRDQLTAMGCAKTGASSGWGGSS